MKTYRSFRQILFCFGLLLFILSTGFALSSCKGGTCAATDDGLNDADSDCVADGSDNCASTYNPSQFDGDEDGVGYACDSNDQDNNVAQELKINFLMSDPTLPETAYEQPTRFFNAMKDFDLNNQECRLFLVGCDDSFLGHLSTDPDGEFSVANPESDAGSTKSTFSILNDFSFYGRNFTSCSAFNPAAIAPPAIFCDYLNGYVAPVGYLTLNPDISDSVNTCEVLNELDREHPECP